jgi:hypothetical protein
MKVSPADTRKRYEAKSTPFRVTMTTESTYRVERFLFVGALARRRVGAFRLLHGQSQDSDSDRRTLVVT